MSCNLKQEADWWSPFICWHYSVIPLADSQTTMGLIQSLASTSLSSTLGLTLQTMASVQKPLQEKVHWKGCMCATYQWGMCTRIPKEVPLLITLIYMFTAYLCGINLCIANQRQSRCVQALRTYTYARIRACGKCWRETPRMLTPHNDEQRRSHSHAIKFGSNTDTDMSDIVFDNITIWDSNGGLAIQQRSEGNTLP